MPRRAGEKCQCPCEQWFLDVRYPYLVVTTMLFIHKLWFDTHISPQEDPQDLPTSAQGHPQICPQGELADGSSTQEGAGQNALPVLSPHRLQGARLADD